MEKTKLGISVGIFGMLLYLAAMFCGYTVMFLLAGYVLLLEENSWLKKAAAKALTVMLAFSAAIFVIGLIPDLFNLLSNLLSIFNVYFHPAIIDKLYNLAASGLRFIEDILLAVLAVLAVNRKSISVPGLDPLLDKFFD